MLKRFTLAVTFFTVFTVSSFAQGETNGLLTTMDRHDVGIFGGVEFYRGDFNDENNLFYKPSIMGGVLYRYNVSRYLALRGQLAYGGVKGSSGDYYGNLPGFPSGATLDFDRMNIMGDILLEFNFFPFSPTDDMAKNYFTPYLVLGVGGAYLGSNRIDNNPNLNAAAAVFPEIYGEPGKTFRQNIILDIPLGVGFKVCPYKRLTLSAEWIFKKTFYDDIDGFTNKGFESVSLYNSDWMTTLTLGLSYRFSSQKMCDSYKKPFKPRDPLKGSKYQTFESKKSAKKNR